MYQSHWNMCTRCQSRKDIKKNSVASGDNHKCYTLPIVMQQTISLLQTTASYYVIPISVQRCNGCSQHNAGVRGVINETLCHLEQIKLYNSILSFMWINHYGTRKSSSTIYVEDNRKVRQPIPDRFYLSKNTLQFNQKIKNNVI